MDSTRTLATKAQPSRWLSVFLIWMMMLVAYMDRVNISVAGPTITNELHLSKTQFGWILGAFSIGYAILQIPGGSLSDRFGSKPVLIVGLLLWSLFTGLTGLCSALIAFVSVRVLFGMGEGLENGAQFKVIGDRFDSKERSKANGIFLSALALGPAIASPLSSYLVKALGWREMFFCYSIVGVVAALVIGAFLPVSKEENASKEPLWTAFKSPTAAKLVGGYFLFNVAFWGFLGWIPTFLKEQRHVALANLGWIGSIPYLAGALGILGAGLLGAKMLETRRWVACAAYLVGAAFLMLAVLAKSLPWTIFALSCASFGLYASFAPFWSMAIDTASESKRGAFTGAVNFGGQLGGFAGQLLIGLIADRTGSFLGVMVLMATALIGAAIIVVNNPTPTDQLG